MHNFDNYGFIPDSLKIINVITEQARETVLAFAKTISLIDMDSIKVTLIKIAQGILETEEDLKIFKLAIVELGYPPHEGMELGVMRGIARAYVEDRETLEEVIDDIMCEYYDDNFISTRGRGWENINILKDRLPILRNVIMAHNQGMYNVSVPTIIAQLEGVLVQTFDIKGYVNGAIIKILLRELLKSEGTTFSFNEEIFKYYEDNLLAQFNHGKILQSDISRNAILHGADITYGRQTVSIKAILLFDFIADKLKNVDKDTLRTAKIKVRDFRNGKFKL